MTRSTRAMGLRPFRHLPRTAVLAVLGLSVLAVAVTSLTLGAVKISPGTMLRIFWTAATGGDAAKLDGGLVVVNIRLPRIVMGLAIGAGLSVCGAFLQGLFRNPLADPGLIGVSSGAALAAAATIVLGDRLFGTLPFTALPVGAFLGGLATTALLYGVATRGGRISIAILLLAGVAVAAFAGAMTGILATVSDDRQLRDLTFWSLGSLSGATWAKVGIVAPVIALILLSLPFLARSLNALALGEAEAFHLGIPVERMKRVVILLCALGVGTSVAAAGIIGFVGIVVPHAVRLSLGADHRILLPASALGGAAFLVLADAIARTVAAPSELPIGILTALIGAPVFLWLLLRGAPLSA